MAALLNTCLKPRKDELEPVPRFHFVHELIDREVTRHRSKKRFDGRLVAVDIEQTTDNLRRANGVDASDVHLDEVRQAALVQVEHKIVNEVEAIADDDQRELI